MVGNNLPVSLAMVFTKYEPGVAGSIKGALVSSSLSTVNKAFNGISEEVKFCRSKNQVKL